MSNQVTSLAEKIARAVWEKQFDNQFDDGHVPVDAFLNVISPLLPEGDGWKERYESMSIARELSLKQANDWEQECKKVDAELAALKAKGDGWIPCAERLPEVGELVDVVANDIAQKLPAFLSGKEFANEDGFEWQWADEECDPAPLEVITHWRKRPTFTPPAEGQPAAKGGK